MTKSTLPKRGRPSILTTDKINRIAKGVQSGKTRDEQAELAGVPVRTLYEWIALGRKIRSNDGGAATGRDLMALRLVLAIENAERKRRAITAIMSDDELSQTVPQGKKPIGRPAVLTEKILEAVTPLCVEGRLREAADAGGVDKRSVLRWLARGREVHANGGARSEYERLCGMLFARVEAAQPSQPPQPARQLQATTAIVEQLIAAVREGATRSQAAERAGISDRTLWRWLALGARVNAAGTLANEHERLCRELRRGVDQADADRRRPAAEPEPARGSAVRSGPEAKPVSLEPVIVIGRPRGSFLKRWITPLFRARQPHRA